MNIYMKENVMPLLNIIFILERIKIEGFKMKRFNSLYKEMKKNTT